jgi:hypothetical protein
MATPGISGFSHPCQPIDPCTDSTGSAGFVGFWLRLGYIIRVPPPPAASPMAGRSSFVHGWCSRPGRLGSLPPNRLSHATGDSSREKPGCRTRVLSGLEQLLDGAIPPPRIRLQPWPNISASLIQVGSTLRSSLWSMLSLEPFVIGICAAGAWDRGRRNTAPPSLGSAPLGSVQG